MRLATKYRPQTFDEVSGQRATIACLRGMAERRDVPSALLFFGAFGSGKTTSARVLAAALNCEAEDRPCGTCPSCKAVAAGTSPDVTEVDAASNGTVDKVREICDLVQYGPAGQWRVVIFDEAQSMSRDAVNHILKTLEEPPPCVVFILVTTERGKLLPTAPSRCIPFAFTRLPAAVVAARLRQVADAEGIAVEDELLAHLAARANGALRDALNYLEQAASVRIRTLAAWRELNCETDFAPALLSAAVSGNHARLYAELDTALLTCSDYAELVRQLAFCLRDILVLATGGKAEHQGEALAARRALAE
jgi:DNA polymerase-3 subunit gamma/tau